MESLGLTFPALSHRIVNRCCRNRAGRFARTFAHGVEKEEVQLSRRVVDVGKLAGSLEIALVECGLKGLGQPLGRRCRLAAGGHGQGGNERSRKEKWFHGVGKLPWGVVAASGLKAFVIKHANR